MTGFEATRRALACGEIDVNRAAMVVSAVQRLTAEHDDLPVGTPLAAEVHLLELAGPFGRPSGNLGHVPEPGRHRPLPSADVSPGGERGVAARRCSRAPRKRSPPRVRWRRQ